jgi:hypothetical protein
MSVQLILYPQYYTGFSFSPTYQYTQFNGNTHFTSPIIQNANISNWSFAVDNTLNYNVGGWTGFSSVSAGVWVATTLPAIISSKLRVYYTTGAGGSMCGVAQQIQGLQIGVNYDLIINHPGVSPSAHGSWQIGGYGISLSMSSNSFIGNNGTVMGTNVTAGNGQTVYNFTAGYNNMKLVAAWYGNGTSTGNFDIESIIVQDTDNSAPFTYTDFEDGQVVCDLYEDESIPLTLSVDNFKNAAENVQSYSKDFDLPATKHNSNIFTHIFDITKTIGTIWDFNAHAQTKAALKEDGVLIFEGSLKLLEIKDQEQEISYNVNLFSQPIALADILRDRDLSHLTDTFHELGHYYTFDSIEDSWDDATGLPLQNPLSADSFAVDPALGNLTNTNVLKYPFIDWTGTIDCTGSTPDVDQLEKVFRPFIQIKYILDNIFDKAGYSYSSAFFDSTNFKKLFMDFNWGDAANDSYYTGIASFDGNSTSYAIGTTTTTVSFQSFDNFDPVTTGWDDTTWTFTCPQNNTYYVLMVSVGVEAAAASINTTFHINKNGTLEEVQTILVGNAANGGATYYVPNYVAELNAGETLKIEAFTASGTVNQGVSAQGGGSTLIASIANIYDFVGGTLVNAVRGELNQWDFFKGLSKMFNLITMPDPDNPTNLIIEPYPDVFGVDATGVTQRDWTYKLDTKDIKLEPLELKKEVIFQYKEDEEDYAFNVYKKSSGNSYLYGSKRIQADNMIIMAGQASGLTGIEEIIAEPFAATICKPIQEGFPNMLIPVIYGQNNDTFESIQNLPRVLFNNGVKTESWECPTQNGVTGGTKTTFLQFSHVTNVPSGITESDYNFGACYIWLGGSPPLNLFNTYYAEYYDQLYNPNGRVLTAKVDLNPSDINTFQFNDVVTLKNRTFRVNRIDYKPNSLSTVEFILIN